MPWLLIIFGICLIIVNIKAINKDNNSFGSVLKYKEEDINDVNIEIGQLRKDFAETILELQKEILDLRAIVEGTNINQEKEINDNLHNIEPYAQNEELINEINVASKTERIKQLIDEGLSDEEICERLSLGKGEVLLVKGLYKH